MSMAPEHRCTVCSKAFKRRVHLKRHAESHTLGRPHRCQLCHGAFQRADILKRHLRTCSSAVPTKRRACDECVRQKRACDLRTPCGNCIKKQRPCRYLVDPHEESASTSVQEVGDASSSLEEKPWTSTLGSTHSTDPEDPTWEDISLDDLIDFSNTSPFDYTDAHWQELYTIHDELNVIEGSDRRQRPCFDFLDAFTRNPGFLNSFDCGTQRDRQDAARIDQRPELPSATPITHSLASMMDVSPMQPSALLWATHQIVLLVKEVVMVKPRNSPVEHSWSSTLETLCAQFFSPQQLQKFLNLYWTIWHPNVNFVHRPTFDPTTCKPILLATMAVIGACISPEPLDFETAKYFFNCVEEMVFTDPDVSTDYGSASASGQEFDPAGDRAKIQTLQAAYMVCLYQNWEGSDTSKGRIRRYRFSTVVSAARDIGIDNARHRRYGVNESGFVWEDFAAREELIRTVLWIFLLDTAFVIFNNLPPRLVIKEATMQMACPEACFQASTGADCLDQIQRWIATEGHGVPMSVLEAVEMIRQPSLTPQSQRVLGYLGPLNLFVLTSSLHSLLFQAQHSLEVPQLTSIRYALHNWREAWQVYCDEYSTCPPHAMVTDENRTVSNMGNRIGFVCHAAEYWLLAKVIADRLSSSSSNQAGTSSALQRETNSGVVTTDTRAETMMSKFDQTSMQQVNDLISVFQNMQFQE